MHRVNKITNEAKSLHENYYYKMRNTNMSPNKLMLCKNKWQHQLSTYKNYLKKKESWF